MLSGYKGRVEGTGMTTASTTDIIRELRLEGLDAVADRLGYLERAVEDDPSESAMQIDSLRHLARFLIAERGMKSPRIGVSPDGRLQIEWRAADGILAMWFLHDGHIQFAAAAVPRPGSERERVSGVLPKDETMQALRPFVLRMGLA